ncbi:Bug family tripartite tricarboxylate transporter substrate binding protein [Streptomyces radicis]|uniref:Tripartite tricarboxylate transporter substrate binding protein n=1 Tax=Streptomyces radicis TaxID=1750517 RepID=A0A3A9WIN8_9ACTN|nr:tripartite tricarboxylate transporter substrate-binding protein [Streptomyces radicis]RKN05967.1 tripartite tricarboxylate transporter substrate binding protein [Streptomyces radicis]RKN17727.1 tripartite tricarboxylate transporter substrate binding protein [Streptomyces radicis]
MRKKRPALAALGVVVTLGLAGFAAVDASDSTTGATPRSKLTLTAPAAAGGGWDLASRELQQALRANSIVNNAQVVNVPGAGGTIGLGQFVELGADPTRLMMTGTVMEGAITVNASRVDLLDTTPIARLAEDYEVFIVPADSPFETLDDFLDAWRADPHGHAIGGGGLGGTDHLLTGLTAREADVDPAEVNYIAFAGGGEVMTALLSGTVELGVSGYNDFRDQIDAGNLRALAVSADEPVPGIDTPTFVEQGIDVALPNWRGVVAPPGISDEERDELIAIVTEATRTPEWEDALSRNRWVDSVLTGDDFGAFIREDQARVDAIIEELGL